MKPTRRRLIQITVILVIAGSILLARFLKSSEEQNIEETLEIPVRVEMPVRRILEETFTAYGNVKSDNQVTVLPKVAGAVTRLVAEVGDKVATGDTLAEIDREAYELDLKRAQAAYASVASTWERVDRLYSQGNATRQNWEETRAAYLAAEAQSSAARLRYDWTLIPSPTNGVVLARHASVGSLVSPDAGTALYTVGSLDQLEVELHLPESRYPALSSGDTELRVFAESFPEVALNAEIRSVAPWVDPVTRSFSVVCTILPSDESMAFLRPGMLLSVSFILRLSDSALTLPESALSSGGRIWRVDSDMYAGSIELSEKNLSSGYLVIPDEFEGEQFVIEGQHFLSEGARVSILAGTK